ncbi:MAG: anti-sigma factor antagonist [Roseiflexus sp.]|nr:anti-sigma factor antagonist [Roseiflexus sp.]MCS7287501.1 anti-sigma factor antagonist [Roseiflexus sp.]MDW8146184.1 anti-sigma factor antagonist [Roseiflexaceae bacterium]MDW8231357.1 anti-sigma factor antagonist [Roseiflexaceae bacterium]
MESLTVPATLESLALISAFVREATRCARLDDHAAWQVELAVDEAATNIIQHGYDPDAPGTIELTWQIEDNRLIITLRDYGRRFNPDDVPPPDLSSPLEERQPGGLGLYLMHRLMDQVRFDFDDANGNLLTMVKYIRPHVQAHEFRLNGRLDAVGTEPALAPVHQAIANGAEYVLLDFDNVTFLSSTALRSLLLARKELLARHGELRLCNLRPQVREVFELTGFTRLFAIHSSRDEALAAFGQEHV